MLLFFSGIANGAKTNIGKKRANTATGNNLTHFGLNIVAYLLNHTVRKSFKYYLKLLMLYQQVNQEMFSLERNQKQHETRQELSHQELGTAMLQHQGWLKV